MESLGQPLPGQCEPALDSLSRAHMEDTRAASTEAESRVWRASPCCLLILYQLRKHDPGTKGRARKTLSGVPINPGRGDMSMHLPHSPKDLPERVTQPVLNSQFLDLNSEHRSLASLAASVPLQARTQLSRPARLHWTAVLCLQGGHHSDASASLTL